jgi:hypothetical protein
MKRSHTIVCYTIAYYYYYTTVCVCLKNISEQQKKIKEGKTFFLYLYFSSRAAAAILQEVGDDGGWHREGVYNTGTLEATHPAAPTLCEISSTNSLPPVHIQSILIEGKKGDLEGESRKYPDHGRSGGLLLHKKGGKESIKKRERQKYNQLIQMYVHNCALTIRLFF